MRPLNRPMFKMGGPVKEGIMDGIREPEPRQGYFLGGRNNRTGLVFKSATWLLASLRGARASGRATKQHHFNQLQQG